MRKCISLRTSAVSAIFLIIALGTGLAIAQHIISKTLQGKVLTTSEAPLSGAIVYLQDNKTSSIRTFISTNDGSYRFGQISPDSDYEVWAKYKNYKSPTKTISSYDTRTQVVIDLHIKTK